MPWKILYYSNSMHFWKWPVRLHFISEICQYTAKLTAANIYTDDLWEINATAGVDFTKKKHDSCFKLEDSIFNVPIETTNRVWRCHWHSYWGDSVRRFTWSSWVPVHTYSSSDDVQPVLGVLLSLGVVELGAWRRCSNVWVCATFACGWASEITPPLERLWGNNVE